MSTIELPLGCEELPAIVPEVPKGAPFEGVPPAAQIHAALLVTYDEATQTVNVTLNPAKVKNWGFAKGLLSQAIDAVELQLKMMHMQAMQAAQAEQMQAMAISQQMGRSRH